MTATGDKQAHCSQSDVLTVLCTCPDAATARRLAGGLVERRLAACVNVLPEIRSIYRWQDAVEEGGEVLMIAKTTASSYPELEDWLARHHPYDVPEILALPVARGSAAYLEWVVSETEN